ncbi:hypothetical protein [Halorussus salinisoli]|nr:hypothetical protein [Halorussus salinisoli]
MGLVETWIDSRGSDGRVKQIQNTFDLQWVRDAQSQFVEQVTSDDAETGE